MYIIATLAAQEAQLSICNLNSSSTGKESMHNVWSSIYECRRSARSAAIKLRVNLPVDSEMSGNSAAAQARDSIVPVLAAAYITVSIVTQLLSYL